MLVSQANWMQVEEWLERDDRAVLPLGCTEQHAYLSLATDSILAERVAAEAAEPLGVPVFPVIAYGITPNMSAYPGTVSVRVETLLAIVRDVLDALASQGFRRIVVVNGHGGNAPVRAYLQEWKAANTHVKVKWHEWWCAPKVWARVQEIDPAASHASWMESFPWTRVEGVRPPAGAKPEAAWNDWLHLPPAALRDKLGDGNFWGRYERPDDEAFALWRTGVAETREKLETGWD